MAVAVLLLLLARLPKVFGSDRNVKKYRMVELGIGITTKSR